MPRKVKQPHGGEVNQWLPGESGNPKGRPRKLVSSVVKGMRDAGLERVTASQVADTMELMLNATKDELTACAMDESQPFLLRLVAKELLSKKGWLVLNDVLNRAHGKPTWAPEMKVADTDAKELRRTTIELPGGLTLDL